MIKKSEILKRAKSVLLEGRTNFVCNAITRVCKDPYAGAGQEEELRGWIKELLENSSTYGAWLDINHPELSDDFWRLPPHRHQEIRAQWVDWMIQYWEGKGE